MEASLQLQKKRDGEDGHINDFHLDAAIKAGHGVERTAHATQHAASARQPPDAAGADAQHDTATPEVYQHHSCAGKTGQPGIGERAECAGQTLAKLQLCLSLLPLINAAHGRSDLRALGQGNAAWAYAIVACQRQLCYD